VIHTQKNKATFWRKKNHSQMGRGSLGNIKHNDNFMPDGKKCLLKLVAMCYTVVYRLSELSQMQQEL
jgi:hypothetical protein